MILLFSVKNFKSIKDELTVDFRKANVSEFKESLISDNVLPSVVFYGPNGAGKSSIIQAMDFLFKFISAPILNFKTSVNGIPTSFVMPKYKPYLFDSNSKNGTTEFSVLFTLNSSDSTEYMYAIELKGDSVISESLYEKAAFGKPSKVFSRDGDSVSLGSKVSGIKLNERIVQPTMAFLSSVSIIYNESLFEKVSQWFCNTITVDYSDPAMEKAVNETSIVFLQQNKEIKNNIEKLLKTLNLGIEAYNISDDKEANLFKRVKTVHKNGELTLFDESMGTRKLLMALPPMYLSLVNGNPFIVDELDAKIHPKLLEYIISLFTNSKINTKGAQLIFTSHDMYTLSNDVFRRDEVYFVAKDLGDSTFCYSLVDIKNEKNAKERNDSSYSKRYLEGKYGADPYFNKMISWGDISNEAN